MSLEALSALISAAGVMSAIVLQIVEWRRARFSRGIEMIAALDERFDGPDLRDLRRLAAAYLQDPSRTDQVGKEAARSIVNFFETLGFLYGKRTIDAESAWRFFASWLLPYYVATVQVRQELTRDDPNVFVEFDRVYRAVKKVEETRHPSHGTTHVVGNVAVAEFLATEAALPMKALPSTTPRP